MNKYQEALASLKWAGQFTKKPNTPQNREELRNGDYEITWFDKTKNFEAIQELVNRATPKQPLNRYTYNTDGGEKVENGECPHCHKAMVRTMDIESSFCDHCGQSLEWEEGEKK